MTKFDIDENWVQAKLTECYGYAQSSPDRSTQNGAMLWSFDEHPAVEPWLLAVGCNAFTAGIDHQARPELHERPAKYLYTEHAERAVIHAYAKTAHHYDRGHAPNVLVCAWAACADCARAIVGVGIEVLVRHERSDVTGRWGESIEAGDDILLAAGVEIIAYTEPLPSAPMVRFGGELWQP